MKITAAAVKASYLAAAMDSNFHFTQQLSDNMWKSFFSPNNVDKEHPD